MATTFYGPWLVVLGPVDSHSSELQYNFIQRFLISGSSNADGIYPVAHGDALVLSVYRAKWHIEMQPPSRRILAGQ